jgi:hypothetical protein
MGREMLGRGASTGHHSSTMPSKFHWKENEQRQMRALIIAIDPHPSVQLIFPTQEQRLFKLFFQLWGRKNNIQIQILHSQSCGGWGEELHRQWQQCPNTQEFQKPIANKKINIRHSPSAAYTGASLLIISDWHGKATATPSLKLLATRHPLKCLQLQHDPPDLKSQQIVRNVNAPHEKGLSLEPSHWIRAHQRWKKELKRTLRELQCSHTTLSPPINRSSKGLDISNLESMISKTLQFL